MVTIMQSIQGVGVFSTLCDGLAAAGLDTQLDGLGHYTLFAPQDDAFARLPKGIWKKICSDLPTLRGILSTHVIRHRMTIDDLIRDTSWRTLLGCHVDTRLNLGLRVGNATVVQADIGADNGIIHVVNRVILSEHWLNRPRDASRSARFWILKHRTPAAATPTFVGSPISPDF